jgi:RNA polymerase sigma-70 factor (ECF subfamily)
MSSTRKNSIRELYAQHRRALLSFLTGKVGREAAPDLLQETFVRALRYEKLDEVADTRAFLRTTAANLSRDYVRRRETEGRHVTPADGEKEHPSADATPDVLLETSEKTARLLAAVNALPPKCRQVFILRRFEDLSQQEIADRLGISRNMVEKHLRLALERCRAAIEEDP